MAEATSISAVDFLLSQGHALALVGASRSDTPQGRLAHTTLRDLPGLLLVLVDQPTSRGPHTEKHKKISNQLNINTIHPSRN